MSDFYIYAETTDIEWLQQAHPKCLLIGSDFGYANFGDILQLKSALRFHKNNTRFTPVPVYALEAISDVQFIKKAKIYLDTKVILFITSQKMDISSLNMTHVGRINGVGLMHLYGGGMLNAMWGKFVLDAVEHFLTRAPDVTYVISGQQVSDEIQERLIKHIKLFKPLIFGVRDFDSLNRVNQWGIKSQYSFDDAYEELLLLVKQIPPAREDRIVGHINISYYTTQSTNEDMTTVLRNFTQLKSYFPNCNFTLLNAYNDKRLLVRDSLSSLSAFENDFPFYSYSVLDLAHAALSGVIASPCLLQAKLGLSCSYHVTLFLHLLKIPCWLIANNKYYVQKARTLNRSSNFDLFINQQTIPDYSERIDARDKWNKLLALLLENKKLVDLIFPHFADCEPKTIFQFKYDGITQKELGDEKIKILCTENEKLKNELSVLIAYLTKQEDGKAWLEAQWRQSLEMIAKQDLGLKEQEEGKAWLEAQWRQGLEMVAKQDLALKEQEKGKVWLEAQWRQGLEIIAKQNLTLKELEEGKAWLETQWRSVTGELDALKSNYIYKLIFLFISGRNHHVKSSD